MPNSVPLILAGLGAILVLLAVTGRGFRLGGGTVVGHDDRFRPAVRWVCAVLGIPLLVTGTLLAWPARPPDDRVTPPASREPAPPPTPGSSGSSSAAPPRHRTASIAVARNPANPTSTARSAFSGIPLAPEAAEVEYAAAAPGDSIYLAGVRTCAQLAERVGADAVDTLESVTWRTRRMGPPFDGPSETMAFSGWLVGPIDRLGFQTVPGSGDALDYDRRERTGRRLLARLERLDLGASWAVRWTACLAR